MSKHVTAGARSLLLALALGVGTSCRAEPLDKLGVHKAESEAKFASGAGNVLFLAAGTFMPLLHKGREGREESARTADAVLTSVILSEGLKFATHEQRPDHSNNTSFPSGHATAAFAVAAMEAHYHPDQALWWYGGATIIGASRVQLERHYWHDVITGAGIGYFTAQLELHQSHGFILRPFISDKSATRTADRAVGVSLTRKF